MFDTKKVTYGQDRETDTWCLLDEDGYYIAKGMRSEYDAKFITKVLTSCPWMTADLLWQETNDELDRTAAHRQED